MKSSFPKFDLQTWHWHCKFNFWIGAYRILENKPLQIYVVGIRRVAESERYRFNVRTEDQEFDSMSSQIIDLPNVYESPPCLILNITRIGKVLVDQYHDNVTE